MNRAFIFDMDGVLIDTERQWHARDEDILLQLFGKGIVDKMENTTGLSISTIFAKGKELGATISYESYRHRYDEEAKIVYAKAHISEHADELAAKVLGLGYHLGLVTSSPKEWVEWVLPRLNFAHQLELVFSQFEHPELQPKPAPAAYFEALRQLNANPSASVILEDSNPGIQAAKAAGVYVIGFRGFLVEGYEQTGADAYADTMDEVGKLVEQYFTRP